MRCAFFKAKLATDNIIFAHGSTAPATGEEGMLYDLIELLLLLTFLLVNFIRTKTKLVYPVPV